MRIVFVHPSREPVACGNGPVRIGSGGDNDVVLTDPGVDAQHLVVDGDGRRGLVLKVLPGCQRVYVNARPVRERALLRHGDVVHLGESKLLLTADRPPPDAGPAETGAGDETARAGLRIVSGPGSGRLLPVGQRRVLGSGRPFADSACFISPTDGGLLLEAGRTKAQVNGWNCSRAWLANGDQIVLGEQRLVVEAPGLQRAAAAARIPPPVEPLVTASAPATEEAPHAEIWWLIAAAAALAAIIALLLYYRW